MKKTLLTIAATIAITTSAQAKEINLECNYKNIEGGTNYENLLLNTDSLKASDGNAVGELLTSPTLYMFQTVQPGIGPITYTVDRETIRFSMKLEDFGRSFAGQCKVVESKVKI